jgi:hypothetical protein
MIVPELKEIQDYWTTKYPNIHITLYSNQDGNKFFGKMMSHDSSLDLNADTIGELIGQGEAFLRTIK